VYKVHDYLLDYEIIVSPERAKRPSQFKEEIVDNEELKLEIRNCPFCPGNEEKTPKEYWKIEKNGQWIIRVFPNKYKIWKNHDVIVDTPDHLEDWDENMYLELVLYAIKKRVEEILKEKEIKYVQVFRNYGKNAGASLRHSHIQLVGFEFLPEQIEKLSYKLNKCSCRICRKKWGNALVLKELNYFRVLALESRFPYEIEIHSKEHKGFLGLNNDEIKELAFILKKIIKRIKDYFDSYNVLFFIEPKNKDFHFFIRIFPRTTIWGGLELSASLIVNPVDKEKCFEFYKDLFE
jgi:UDPglucose--hexose-1-phosphate uridylyltransferase